MEKYIELRGTKYEVVRFDQLYVVIEEVGTKNREVLNIEFVKKLLSENNK